MCFPFLFRSYVGTASIFQTHYEPYLAQTKQTLLYFFAKYKVLVYPRKAQLYQSYYLPSFNSMKNLNGPLQSLYHHIN